MLGAIALVVLGLILPGDAMRGVAKGRDVYLFLVGMMVLAELAREEGLFDWLAALAAVQARGSAGRLFALIYVVGTFVTVFLSNDATAVVLTPAVYAAAKAAKAEPLPYLFVCAFIANAASFVLPISNPANLVIFGDHMPPLLTWLSRFALASVLSIGVTYIVLRCTQARALRKPVARNIEVPRLSSSGRMSAFGIAATAVALLLASAFNVQLGWPTCLASVITLAIVAASKRSFPGHVLRSISWSVLPLVAGLFVLVEGLGHTGLLQSLSQHLHEAAAASPSTTVWGSGVGIAFLSNLMNNLPAGLIGGESVHTANVPDAVQSAILIGVDIGPNLSVTGSLATILWLTALRREGQAVSGWTFLKLGMLVMPPALVAALAGAFLFI
ncbi:Arsenical pump membrane protein [Hyphomicrobium sp. ghe19]|nr:Arsenical pump membrane protein [Hyphomicrobium sp. ghe19]